MSTALSVRNEALPALASLPRLSGSLAYFVGGDRVIGGDLHPVHGTPGARDIAEARERLPEVEFMCRPPTEALIREWCKKLIPSLPRAPVGPDELKRVVDGLLLACGDLPFAVWTVETAAAALRTLEWWPPPAKVRAILQPFADRITRLRDGLARIIESAEREIAPSTVRIDPAPASIAHVSAVVGAFTAERSFNDPNHPQAASVVKASPLSDGALLAAYEKEAEGDGPFAKMSASRAEVIRKRIAAAADFYS